MHTNVKKPGAVVHSLKDLPESKARLVYAVSSRTDRDGLKQETVSRTRWLSLPLHGRLGCWKSRSPGILD